MISRYHGGIGNLVYWSIILHQHEAKFELKYVISWTNAILHDDVSWASYLKHLIMSTCNKFNFNKITTQECVKKVQTELDAFDGWCWLEAHESILAQANESNFKYIVAWWVGQNWNHLGHEDCWFKWFIMNIFYWYWSSLLQSYIGLSLHSKRWYEKLIVDLAWHTLLVCD